ncbi:MAG: 3'(2'),5'-bisphosphate nucleotidase CysQ [Cyclobacteriaceae bacterium]
MAELENLLRLAIAASEEACAAILEVYNSNNFETELKGDNSPLTLADKKSHEVIERHLKATGIPILSEEGKDIPYEARKNWHRLWLVDPLDGTKEFIKRNGEFTVNIALIENQQPILGVVAVPVTGEVFFGGIGLGVTKRSRNSKFEIQDLKSKQSEILNFESGIRVVASRSHMNDETKAFIEKLGPTEIISAGSSLKFMLLAEGKADIYPRFGPTLEWDTAAAHAILNALGLSLKKTDGGEELKYNKENLLNPYFIAG